MRIRDGDICDSREDLLVVSGHTGRGKPPGGQVIDALGDRFGLGFGSLSPLLVPRGVFGTWRVDNLPDSAPFRQAPVVRFPGAADVGPAPMKVYE